MSKGSAKSAGAGNADTLFEQAPIAMHEIDAAGIIRRVNRAECELLGFKAGELLDRSISEFVSAASRDVSRDAMRRKLSGEQPLAPFCRELTRRDGRRVTVEIHESYIRDDAGNITGMRSALLDVSERQRAQEELRHAHEQLEARVRERTLELARANDALRNEVKERRRAEQRLAVQVAIARVLAESQDAATAVPRLLEAVCDRLGWDLGVCWKADSAARTLKLGGLWQRTPGPECADRLAARSFAEGEAAPGAVWKARRAAWIDSPLEDALGLEPDQGVPCFRSGLVFAVPASSADGAVMGFFSRELEDRDEDLLRTAALVGSQIGQFLDGKVAETARDRSDARFTAFMDHLPGVAFMKDTDSRYVFINPAAGTLLGIPEQGIIGKTDADLWPPEIAAAIMAQDRQVLETGRPAQVSEQLPHPQRGMRSWLVYKFPVCSGGSRPLYVGGVALDVTEHNLLEDQLRQSQKMDAIGRLAGGVAHDFNNLLTIIGGYGRMVMDKLPADDRARGSMELILNATDRAAVLTSQLLAFSRRQVVQPKLIELNHVISNLEKMLRRVIGEHISLETDLDSALTRIKADAGQIEQILMNLAINARDAMPQGGTLTIQTAQVSHRGAPYIRLSVSDTGIGMDQQTKSRLFEPFFTTKGRGKGTGLGLSTVYGIVKQHGGEIAVVSHPGAGARFHIFLPAAVEQPEAEAPQPAAPGSDRGSETILLVEDDAGVRRVARDALRNSGYRVLEAGDGQEALRIAEREAAGIDVLVTDMIMPLMSGRELATRMLERDKTLRVIFMSGYTDDVIAYHGELGPDADFLQKPFAPGVLARKVRRVLDAARGTAGKVRST